MLFENIELSVTSTITEWLNNNITINVFVLIIFLFTIINSFLVLEYIKKDVQLPNIKYPFYAIMSCIFLLFTMILFIDLYLFVLTENEIVIANTSTIELNNYLNIILLAIAIVCELFAIIFALMYSSKTDNMLWFYCFALCICFNILIITIGTIVNFIKVWANFGLWYLLAFSVAIGIAIIVLLKFSEQKFLLLNFFVLLSTAIMFAFNFKGLFLNENASFLLAINNNYYQKKLIPQVANDYISTISNNLLQLQTKITNLSNQMQNIYSTYVCNQSVNVENTRYNNNLSQVETIKQNIKDFNTLLQNNIDYTGNIEQIKQQLLITLNVAKGIASDYFTNKFVFSSYFPTSLSFIQWIYEITSLIKSSGYINRRESYVDSYIIDGNFAVSNNQSRGNSSRINLFMGMSLTNLMSTINISSATFNNNIMSINGQPVAGVCNLFNSIVFKNIFEFCDLNWSNGNMFCVNLVYNMIPYSFIFNGTVDGNSSLVGILSNNYILYLFDSTSNCLYYIDFVNKTYEIYKCFSILNSCVYNSDAISFSIKNSDSSVFFQQVGNGLFDSLTTSSDGITYEFINSETNNFWMFDFKNIISNSSNTYYAQDIEIMNGNNRLNYQIFNNSDNLQFNDIVLFTINKAIGI